jgi:hypothetical protein
MCLSIYETADGKIQLMEDQPIGKKPMEPIWCFRKNILAVYGYLSA